MLYRCVFLYIGVFCVHVCVYACIFFERLKILYGYISTVGL